MPKFMTYQRPSPVAKQNWNHTPDRKAKASRQAPEEQKPAAPVTSVPALEQLVRKQ